MADETIPEIRRPDNLHPIILEIEKCMAGEDYQKTHAIFNTLLDFDYSSEIRKLDEDECGFLSMLYAHVLSDKIVSLDHALSQVKKERESGDSDSNVINNIFNTNSYLMMILDNCEISELAHRYKIVSTYGDLLSLERKKLGPERFSNPKSNYLEEMGSSMFDLFKCDFLANPS